MHAAKARRLARCSPRRNAVTPRQLGREGKKSMEGSFAMFCVCFIIGNTIFAEVRPSANSHASGWPQRAIGRFRVQPLSGEAV